MPIYSAPVAEQRAYVTADAAATDGIRACLQISANVETAGAVYELNGAFHWTQPAGNGERAEVDDLHVMLPASAKFVALFYIHPAEPLQPDDMSEYFSEADISAANTLHVTSYVGVVKSHTVIRYTPGGSNHTTTIEVGGKDHRVALRDAQWKIKGTVRRAA